MARLSPKLMAAAACALMGVTACGSSGDETPAAAQTASSAAASAPVLTHWEDVQGVMVPISAADGPASGAWEPYHGYSRTPQGAALAAIGQSVQLATATDARWAVILSGVAAPGEGRDIYAANRSLLSVTGPVDPEIAPEIAGYVVASYSGNRAEIDVISRYPDDSLGSSRATVVWVGGDWKLALPRPDEADPAQVLTAPPPAMVDLEEEK